MCYMYNTEFFWVKGLCEVDTLVQKMCPYLHNCDQDCSPKMTIDLTWLAH